MYLLLPFTPLLKQLLNGGSDESAKACATIAILIFLVFTASQVALGGSDTTPVFRCEITPKNVAAVAVILALAAAVFVDAAIRHEVGVGFLEALTASDQPDDASVLRPVCS